MRNESIVVSEGVGDSSDTAKIVYILYLVGLFIPLTSLVGLIFAYVKNGSASGWLGTHYRWQIRTFWIGLFLAFVGIILMIVTILGMVVFPFLLVWVIVRCVKGLDRLGKSQPISNPASWLW